MWLRIGRSGPFYFRFTCSSRGRWVWDWGLLWGSATYIFQWPFTYKMICNWSNLRNDNSGMKLTQLQYELKVITFIPFILFSFLIRLLFSNLSYLSNLSNISNVHILSNLCKCLMCVMSRLPSALAFCKLLPVSVGLCVRYLHLQAVLSSRAVVPPGSPFGQSMSYWVRLGTA
jgi:hypothetical protein